MNFHFRGLLIDGHGQEQEVLGDCVRFQLGAGWLHASTHGRIEFQTTPTVDFGIIFFNSTEHQNKYLGFLKPLDAEQSRKSLSLHVPQRVAFRLGENFKLFADYGLSIVYWWEKDAGLGEADASARRLVFDVDIGRPTLYYGYGGRLGISLTPTGSLKSPRGTLEISYLF